MKQNFLPAEPGCPGRQVLGGKSRHFFQGRLQAVATMLTRTSIPLVRDPRKLPLWRELWKCVPYDSNRAPEQLVNWSSLIYCASHVSYFNTIVCRFIIKIVLTESSECLTWATGVCRYKEKSDFILNKFGTVEILVTVQFFVGLNWKWSRKTCSKSDCKRLLTIVIQSPQPLDMNVADGLVFNVYSCMQDFANWSIFVCLYICNWDVCIFVSFRITTFGIKDKSKHCISETTGK